MNSKAKLKIFGIISLLALFVLIQTSKINFNYVSGNNYPILVYREHTSLGYNPLEVSAISGKIYIDGNSGWTAFKAAGNCIGDGSYSEPYIIKDLVIDGEGSGSCISIENSDVYFRIENCCLYNAGTNYAGIELYDVVNSQLIDNFCTSNEIGIELFYSHNNTIWGNNASNNDINGIYLSSCDNNILLENIADGNENGIVLSFSDNNTLVENVVTNNDFWYGIDLSSSHNNTLLGNIAISNLNGIVLFYSDNNTISGNTASKSVYIGVYLHSSHYNIVKQNMIKENGFNDFGGGTGLYIGNTGTDTSHENSIFLNCFIDNNKNAFDDGVNYWDNGIKGNYWSDYTGSDSNSDGIGDVPYDNIFGAAGNQDNFPLMKCPILTQNGGVIPAYNLFIVIGILAIGVIIISKKLKRT